MCDNNSLTLHICKSLASKFKSLAYLVPLAYVPLASAVPKLMKRGAGSTAAAPASGMESLKASLQMCETPTALLCAALAAASALVVFFIVSTLIKAYLRHRDTSLPPVVHPNTFLGSSRLFTFLEFSKSPLKMITRLYKDYGTVFTLNMMGQNITILLGPEAQEPFFKSPDDVLSQSEVYGFMKPVFGSGVVYDCPARARQTQFQSMAHGLRNSRLKTYVGKIERETQAYLDKKWGDSGVVDLHVALSEITILTASRCLHGDDVREQLFEEVANLYHDLDKVKATLLCRLAAT